MGLKWKSSSLTSSSSPSESQCVFSIEGTECVTASADCLAPQTKVLRIQWISYAPFERWLECICSSGRPSSPGFDWSLICPSMHEPTSFSSPDPYPPAPVLPLLQGLVQQTEPAKLSAGGWRFMSCSVIPPPPAWHQFWVTPLLIELYI